MMKSKNTYILLASVLMLASSCQKEIGLIESGNDGLSFSVSYASTSSQASTKGGNVAFTDENGNPAPFTINLSVEDTKVEPVTKGTPINNLAKFVETFDAFRAWGWAKSGSNWTDVWNSGNGTKIKQIEPGSTEYRPVDNSDNFIKAYDPAAVASGQYRFYALAPYGLSNPEVTSLTCAYDKLSFTYTSPKGTGDKLNKDAEVQQEVLAGYMKSGDKLKKDVPMTFSPVLAAIQFRVSTNQLGRDVTIKSIELHKLSKTGTCSVSQTGVAWSDLGTQGAVGVQPATFIQTFDYDIDHTDTSGPEINDSEHTKTFFIIPQTGLSEVTGGEPTGTRIVIKYCEKGKAEVKEARHLLFGQKFDAGKTYIYNVGNFEGNASKMEPWVEFSKFTAYPTDLITEDSEIHEENNSKFMFDFQMNNARYEKANFKIHNLEKNHWYTIEFTERLSEYYKKSGNPVVNPFGDRGSYACRIEEVEADAVNQNGMLPYYTATASHPSGTQPFIWEHPNNISNKTDYTPFLPYDETEPGKGKKAILTFRATAENGTPMYWQWDYSRGDDGTNAQPQVLRAEIYVIGNKITDITPEPDVPTVDFLNSTLYNCTTGSDNYGTSSMKTYAIDATAGTEPAKGTLYFRVRNGGYGRINIPLKNLTPSKNYRITYTMNKEKSGTTAEYNASLGYVLRKTANTGNTNMTGESGYVSLKSEYGAQNTFNFTKSFEFTTSDETMYWVWDFSSFARDNATQYFITFSDVTIEEVTTP